MNIFFLDLFTRKCAAMHIDVHVRKMIIEYAQMLSTAHRYLDGVEFVDMSGKRKVKRWFHKELDDILYKSVHVNHPCTIWVRKSVYNYSWLYQLFVDLCDEYIFRFGKVHLTDKKLREVLKKHPTHIPIKPPTKFPTTFPTVYLQNNSNGIVDCYRIFYTSDKKTDKNGKRIDKWTNRGGWF